ncbi:MAG: hypothetical protein ACPGYT_03510 [Nitrospirales bacterium]
MAKMRSPNYPSLSLTEAIGCARILWDKEKRTVISPEVAVKALGYKSLSGVSRTKLASLRKYGLIEDSRGGITLSDLAIKILHSTDASDDYMSALQEASLMPELFRELQQTHGESSDESLKAHLMIERRFSEEGARLFTKSFRDTMTLAFPEGMGYFNHGTIIETDKEPENISSMTDKSLTQVATPPAVNTQVFSWPLSKEVTAEVRLTGKVIKPSHIELLTKYLELAKDAIGTEEDDEEVSTR